MSVLRSQIYFLRSELDLNQQKRLMLLLEIRGSMISPLHGSLLLMRELDAIAKRVRSPLLVGPSRKRFIGEVSKYWILLGVVDIRVGGFPYRCRRPRRHRHRHS